jgi:hypothetical protein
LIQIKASGRLRYTLGYEPPNASDFGAFNEAVSVEAAIAMIPNGATVMVGGFMGLGTPERLLDEWVRQRRAANG